MFKEYKTSVIIMRRLCVAIVGVLLFPFVAFFPEKKSIYSHLHAVWVKKGTQPVWMSEAEKAVAPFIEL